MAEPVISTYSTERPPEDVARIKRRRDWLLWLVVLGVPTLWLTHLQVIYAIALWSRRTGRTWPLHVAVVASLLLCAGASWLTWRTYRKAYAAQSPRLEEIEEERVRMTIRFAGWGLALFVLGIFAQWAAIFMVDPTID